MRSRIWLIGIMWIMFCLCSYADEAEQQNVIPSFPPYSAEYTLLLSDLLTNGTDASQLWNDFLRGKNSSPLQVVLHGCYTASMAETLSKEFPDAYFTEATTETHSEGTKELGPYNTLKLKIGKQEYDIGIKTSKGYWNTYKNGTLIKVESSPSPSPLNSDNTNETH